MPRAKIINGVWERNVTWSKDNEWRTDIFKSTLANSELKTARFVLKNGQCVSVPATELKRILLGGTEHYDDKIWGPFNINPVSKTLNGVRVTMNVE